MNKDVEKFIESLITESEMDNRISDGVINLGNVEHVQVLAEKLYDANVDEETINEFVKKFMDEGKYPDRQAFNREGWLVTFPSKEYRDRAIKKGTHSLSDPTHGKGGMNLYYKKRGKQKRQTQQDPTTTEPASSAQQAVPTPQPKQQPQVSTAGEQPQPNEPSKEPSIEAPSDEQEFDRLAGNEPEDDSGEPTSGGSSLPAADAPEEKSSNTTSSDVPSKPITPPASVAPSLPPTPELSKKFALQKGWVATPYGEWRNQQGETVAVQSLSNEVVPTKSVDRDELKLFVDKQKPA